MDPEPLDLATVERGLCARRVLARELRIVDDCASTSDLLREEMAAAGAGGTPRATLLVAERQSGGRGRRARDWWSGPPGANLACTLRVPDPPDPPLVLALLGACALAAACERLVDAPVALKWPNDLLVGGAKAGGLLGEVPAEGGGAALLGLGVNLGAAPPREAAPYPATRLHDHPRRPPDPSGAAPPAATREELLIGWLWGLERRLARLAEAGPEEFEAECLQRLRAWAPHGIRPTAGGTAGPLLEFSVSSGLAWGRIGANERLPLGQVPALEAL